MSTTATLLQIAPFPHDIVLRVLRQYAHAEVCWAQEEPKNQGPWAYIRCAPRRAAFAVSPSLVRLVMAMSTSWAAHRSQPSIDAA